MPTDSLQSSQNQNEVSRLFARYAQRLARLAEQNLDRRLAGKLDGEDVVQSVFRTFFRRSAEGEFRIDSSADVWQLLVRITLMKTHAEARYHTAVKRDARAEPALAEAMMSKAVSREPSPEEAAAFVDLIESLLEGLPEWYCTALHMRLAGHSVTEVAETLNLSRQTIHRGLHLLQHRLERSNSEDS